jgi:hypothetical protein
VRFQVLTTASMKFRFVFWDVLPCKIIVDRRFRGTCCLHQIALMMEAVRTTETSVENYFTRQYIPEDKYGTQFISCRTVTQSHGNAARRFNLHNIIHSMRQTCHEMNYCHHGTARVPLIHYKYSHASPPTC